MGNSSDELIRVLDDLRRRTESGEISWARSNPTTFTWTRELGDQKIRSTLQRVSKTVRIREAGRIVTRARENFIFQVHETASNLQAMSVDSEESVELRQPLRSLYEAAAGSITQKGLDLLKRALE